jgi:hypothetical protein
MDIYTKLQCNFYSIKIGIIQTPAVLLVYKNGPAVHMQNLCTKGILMINAGKSNFSDPIESAHVS